MVTEECHQEIFTPEDFTIDFRKLMATQVKNNPRVHLPMDRPPKEEALITTRGALIDQETLGHLASMKPQDTKNLPPSETSALDPDF